MTRHSPYAGKRTLHQFHVYLRIPEEVTPDQQDALLDEVSEVIDSCQIADFIRNRVGPYGVSVEVLE